MDAEEQSFSLKRSARKNELQIFILSLEWKFLCCVSDAFDVLHFQIRPSLCRYLKYKHEDLDLVRVGSQTLTVLGCLS